MGYPFDLFIDPDISRCFKCAMCQNVLKDPIALTPCGHIYCRACIPRLQHVFSIKDECPMDRAAVTGSKSVQRKFATELGELKMRCPFNGAGCIITFKLKDFTDHDERCKYNPENQKECADGCGAILNKRQIRLKMHSCVEYLRYQLTEKEQLLKTKDKELGLKAEELASYQKQSHCHHCPKRTWKWGNKETPSLDAIEPKEFRCVAIKNVDSKLYHKLVNILCEKLAMRENWQWHWHHFAETESLLEATLNRPMPCDGEGRISGLHGQGSWNVWMCDSNCKFPPAARQTASASASESAHLEVILPGEPGLKIVLKRL